MEFGWVVMILWLFLETGSQISNNGNFCELRINNFTSCGLPCIGLGKSIDLCRHKIKGKTAWHVWHWVILSMVLEAGVGVDNQNWAPTSSVSYYRTHRVKVRTIGAQGMGQGEGGGEGCRIFQIAIFRQKASNFRAKPLAFRARDFSPPPPNETGPVRLWLELTFDC